MVRPNFVWQRGNSNQNKPAWNFWVCEFEIRVHKFLFFLTFICIMATNVIVKTDPDDICERILSLCRDSPQGIGDKFLQTAMPDVDPKSRAKAINQVSWGLNPIASSADLQLISLKCVGFGSLMQLIWDCLKWCNLSLMRLLKPLPKHCFEISHPSSPHIKMGKGHHVLGL